MATVAQINTNIDAAAVAILDSDWSTALPLLVGAQVLMAAIPDLEKAEEKVRWRPEAIDSAIAKCQSLQAAARGIKRQRIKLVRPTS